MSEEKLYRFRRYNSKGVLMAEGVRVKAQSLEDATKKAKALYSPWNNRESLELVAVGVEGEVAKP